MSKRTKYEPMRNLEEGVPNAEEPPTRSTFVITCSMYGRLGNIFFTRLQCTGTSTVVLHTGYLVLLVVRSTCATRTQ